MVQGGHNLRHSRHSPSAQSPPSPEGINVVPRASRAYATPTMNKDSDVARSGNEDEGRIPFPQQPIMVRRKAGKRKLITQVALAVTLIVLVPVVVWAYVYILGGIAFSTGGTEVVGETAIPSGTALTWVSISDSTLDTVTITGATVTDALTV
ncbi:hypothetical protein KIPB_008740, partial [Kipferlia bialata]|eukprot:g3495.t1